MNEVIVSIVMPAYNCERFIGQAVESVLSQTMKELELIVVIDSSEDRTEDVVKRYTEDIRVSYIVNEKNLGVAESRNRGVSLAKGKYVAFLDADDYWLPNKLEMQMDLMEKKEAVLSSTARELMDEQGKLTGKCIPIKEEITYKQLLCGNILNTSGVMVLTEVAREFPMKQDDCIKKPNSLVADFDKIPQCVELALKKEQMQPILY